MLPRNVRVCVNALVLPCAQVLLYFFAMTSLSLADWNSGLTIEDVSTRIAINIVDDGVQVTVALTDSAITQLKGDKTKTGKSLNSFSQKVIRIVAETELHSSLKTASTSYIETFSPFSAATQPNQLEIIPDFDLIKQAGEQYIITVSHQGLPVIDHGVLTQSETLILNWQDPWYSHFTNEKLKRDHNDPVMAFLYIEPFQIKSEIIVRVKEMSNWTDLQLRDSTMIYPDEFALIKQKIGQFLLAQNKVSTESETLSGVLGRVDFIRMGAADIQAYEPQQAQRQVSTLIGVSITHQTKALPAKARWHWKLFNKKLQRIVIRAYDPAGLFDSYVTPDYPVFEWENMLADIELPELSNTPQSIAVTIDNTEEKNQYYYLLGLLAFLILSIFSCQFIQAKFRTHCKIAAVVITLLTTAYLLKSGNLAIGSNYVTLNEQQSKPVLNQLLWNIYQAFESNQEDAIYDQLAFSVSGDLRETLYLQNRQAFLLQDGAQSKINAIKIKKLTTLSSTFDQAYLFDCEWLVIGDVIHWGHQHRRENLYRANIKIAPIKGNWKIIELESIGQQRVDTVEP